MVTTGYSAAHWTNSFAMSRVIMAIWYQIVVQIATVSPDLHKIGLFLKIIEFEGIKTRGI
jgi:hypothetical protein